MRIFGKICSFIGAAGFTILAISAFNGYTFSNAVVGVFFILFALESVTDGFAYFKKPLKTVKFKNLLTFKDGTTQAFDSDLSLKEKNGAHTTDDVKSIYSEIAEDFENE